MAVVGSLLGPALVPEVLKPVVVVAAERPGPNVIKLFTAVIYKFS